MASFDLAIRRTLEWEGGYTNDPDDPGGETRWGISARANPDVDVADLTEEQAIDIYRTKYWLDVYDDIIAECIGAKVFDLAVNMGHGPAHVCLQRALRAVGIQIKEDGVFGKITLKAVNKVSPSCLLAAMRSEAAGHYRMIGKKKYMRGWLNRAYS